MEKYAAFIVIVTLCFVALVVVHVGVWLLERRERKERRLPSGYNVLDEANQVLFRYQYRSCGRECDE